MFILFGSRASKLNNGYRLQGSKCAYCGNQDTLYASVYGRYFHIFFIPIFPLWKTTVAECSHCKKSYDNNQFTPEMRMSLAQQQVQQPAKRPFWHGIGCLLFILVFLLITISTMVAIFSADEKSSDGPDYAGMLRNDLDKAVPYPDEKTDSASYLIKTYMDLTLTDEIDKDDIKYYSRIENGKMLVLVKVDQMKKIEKETRKEFMVIIKQALAILDMPETERAYIGVHGRWNMNLASSPTHEDLSGDFADDDILYPFYYVDELPGNKTVDTDSGQLKVMEN